MIAGPGDGNAAAAAGRLRASSADRDHAVDVLKVAFVQGRLSMDEFDARIGQVLTSRTQADLTVVTDDIPAGLPGVRRPRRRTPWRRSLRSLVCRRRRFAAPLAAASWRR